MELHADYADWSDAARVGMSALTKSATLTVAVNGDGRLSLYLERGSPGSLLHIEVKGEDARKLYDFLQARCGESSQQKPGSKRSGRKK
jgi:hypothetical protein